MRIKKKEYRIKTVELKNAKPILNGEACIRLDSSHEHWQTVFIALFNRHPEKWDMNTHHFINDNGEHCQDTINRAKMKVFYPKDVLISAVHEYEVIQSNWLINKLENFCYRFTQKQNDKRAEFQKQINSK